MTKAVVRVEKKSAEIDGKPITWNVLQIIGYLGGDFQTLELKMSKTEAMLAGMLLAADEEVTSHRASKDEGSKIEVKRRSISDDIEDELEL